ncbi:hypothetical protein ACLOJK_026794 [Asimina triloba]
MQKTRLSGEQPESIRRFGETALLSKICKEIFPQKSKGGKHGFRKPWQRKEGTRVLQPLVLHYKMASLTRVSQREREWAFRAMLCPGGLLLSGFNDDNGHVHIMSQFDGIDGDDSPLVGVLKLRGRWTVLMQRT